MNKNSVSIQIACSFCGKQIVRSTRNGMTCEDLCVDKWARWDRLGRPAFQEYLGRIGRLDDALAEREALRILLFREDGTPKFSGVAGDSTTQRVVQ